MAHSNASSPDPQQAHGPQRTCAGGLRAEPHAVIPAGAAQLPQVQGSHQCGVLQAWPCARHACMHAARTAPRSGERGAAGLGSSPGLGQRQLAQLSLLSAWLLPALCSAPQVRQMSGGGEGGGRAVHSSCINRAPPACRGRLAEVQQAEPPQRFVAAQLKSTGHEALAASEQGTASRLAAAAAQCTVPPGLKASGSSQLWMEFWRAWWGTHRMTPAGTFSCPSTVSWATMRSWPTPMAARRTRLIATEHWRCVVVQNAGSGHHVQQPHADGCRCGTVQCRSQLAGQAC